MYSSQFTGGKFFVVAQAYNHTPLPNQTVQTGSLCYGLIANVFAFDVPPPGAAFTTVTEAIPAVPMSAAEMEAVTFVLLKNVVGRGAPFQFTTELLRKFEPFTVSVKAEPQPWRSPARWKSRLVLDC
jgi:hypothetical protein